MQFFISTERDVRGECCRMITHHGRQFTHTFEIGAFQVCGKKINDILRKRLRKQEGKESQASAGILDSQSVKTTSTKGIRGYDGGKKINGRKRHILVDTLGLLIAVVVHAADIQDRDGGLLVFERIKNVLSQLKLIWADGGYRGQFIDKVRSQFHRRIEIVKRNDDVKGFKLLPKRWIVERTFGWLSNYRRHSKDYEGLPENSEAMVYISMIQVMLRRI